jgi:uncharacterized protein (TIGR03086 family)
MPTIPDLRAADEAAVRASVALVGRVQPEDLRRPTPCTEWDLAALIAHMTAQHLGFAASAAGAGATLAEWRPVPAGPADYAAAAERVLAAFRPDEVLDRPFALPEFGPGVTVRGRQAVSFHFIDYVVHGWDVAASLGVPFTLPPEVLALAVPVAEAVPSGSAAFAAALPTPSGDDPLARILTLLGRAPDWAPAPRRADPADRR